MKKSKAPIGVRLNNPFNIRYSRHNKWLGQIGNVNGFCKFIQPWYGVRAFGLIYRSYLRTGRNTISEFLRCYAPSVENDTNTYIDFVCVFMGCVPSHRLTIKDFRKFAKAVCSVELGDFSKQYFELIDLYCK